MQKYYRIKGLDCAHCAARLERELNKLSGIREANVNFLTQKISVLYANEDFSQTEKTLYALAAKIEPECEITAR